MPLISVAALPQIKPALWLVEFLVRAKGIEPSPKAWEAFVLPLYYARKTLLCVIL